MKPVGQWLRALLAKVYQPRSSDGLREWAEKWIVLRKTESPKRQGPYRGDDTIPVTKLLDTFVQSSEWRSLTVEKCSQSALTLHTLIYFTRRAAEDPINAIYAIDSAVEAGNISRRLQHLLADCALTREAFHRADRHGDVTGQRIGMPGMNIYLVGAGSAGQLASKVCGVAAGDEIDVHPLIDGEAPTTELLADRTKTIDDAKIFQFSKPTTASGQVHVEHERGSQHRYFVPCPHCGHMQQLVWDGFKFGHCLDLAGFYDKERVERETFYECEGCHEPILEKHKRKMIEAGEWRPTNFREIDDPLLGKSKVPNWASLCMSARLPEWYGFHANSTWGKLAVRWIDAQDQPGKLHAFFNSVRAEPFLHRGAEISEDAILRLRGAYKRGALPWVPAMGGMAVDIQGDVLKWVKGGFAHNGTLAVSDWGECLSIEEVEEIADAPMLCPDGRGIVCQRIQIDEGHIALVVRKFCWDRIPRFYPSKGAGGLSVRDITTWREHKVDQGGLTLIPVLHYSDDAFKHELYIRMIQKFDAKKAEAFNSARLWLPEHVDPQLVRELQGERLEKREIKNRPGHQRWEWVQSPPNDFGDCVKMLRVMWSVFGAEFELAKAG